ncbi:MAG TPA: glycine zipper domain-containing protein [Devosia sp.]
MHKFILVCASVLTLTACSTTEKAATVGGVAGAVIGGATTGNLVGAAVGGAIGATTGAVAGELLGRYRDDPTQCVYVDRRGNRYLDDCPRM